MKNDFPGAWQKSVRQMLETGGEIQRGAAFAATHKDITFSQMWHGDHESTHAALADVFVIFPGEVPGNCGNRRAGFR